MAASEDAVFLFIYDMECSYTPLYESYYIEGIDQLYEAAVGGNVR